MNLVFRFVLSHQDFALALCSRC